MKAQNWLFRMLSIITLVAILIPSSSTNVRGASVGGASESSSNAQATTLIFSDDFSTDKSWTDESGGYIHRDTANQWLLWQVQRDVTRRYYIPINADSGYIRLNYRFKVTDAGGNGDVFFGLVENLSGAQNRATFPTGFFINMGHDTIGLDLAHHYVTYSDHEPEQPPPGDCGSYACVDPATYLNLEAMNVWRRIELVIDHGNWTMTLYDDNNVQMDQSSGTMASTHSRYQYLMIFRDYTGGWEWENGLLDDIELRGAQTTLTQLSIRNDNTGGNVIFTVLGTNVSCTVPDNTTQFCGSFSPGTYTVHVQSTCSDATFSRTFNSGPVTIQVFCQDSTDTTPPAAITNLSASTGSTSGTVDLTWTAPGDDGNTGTASTYIVRYGTSAITTETAWAAANDVSGEPTPGPAGSAESMTVSGLTPGQTYYFAIKTQDEVPNTSGLSTTSPSAVAGATVSISHLEVIQVTQDTTNSVPLIAGKPTLVRVYVDCVDCAQGAKLPGVTGTLEVSTAPRLFDPDNPGGSITAYPVNSWIDQRDDLDKTLNFLIPGDSLNGNVSMTAAVGGDLWREPFPFKQAKELEVVVVPIRYKDKVPEASVMHEAVYMARLIYPTAEVNVAWYFSPLDWSLCLEKNCQDYSKNREKLFNRLRDFAIKNGHPGAFVYGFLPEASISGGQAQSPIGSGVAAIGDYGSIAGHGPDVFVHELGHLMGRHHTNTVANRSETFCTLNHDPVEQWYLDEQGNAEQWEANVDLESDWITEDGVSLTEPPPFPDSFIQQYGFRLDLYPNNKDAVQRPRKSFDFMSYCGWPSLYTVWTSPWTYEKLYEKFFDVSPMSSQDIGIQSSPHVIISGLVYTDDTVVLDPAWVVDSNGAVGNPPPGTEYCLEIRDAAEMLLAGYCFDLDFLDYEEMEARDVVSFSIMLPYPVDAARIVLKKGAQELATQTVSANPPQVRVISPNGGETWSADGTYTISWTGSDADGDTLTYSVQYSPDGSSWMSVGNLTTETQITVDASELAGSDGARIRVLATDGFNTSNDESDAPFTVERKGPQVYILSPEEGSTVLSGAVLYLQGSAYDLEDGALGESSLRWDSSQDGDLGTGSLVRATLSEGQHVITLLATDNDGNIGTASIKVSVGFKQIYLPIILKNH
jgi:hypothetical protein